MIEDKIKNWHKSRGLFGKETTQGHRLKKLKEEFNELCEAVLKNDTHESMLELGDMYVVMVGIAYKLGSSVHDCAWLAYQKIKDRRGKLIDGIFVKEEDLL